jgi:hypothetical protein
MSGQDQIRVLVAENATLRLQLAAANKRAEVAEAEVKLWRGAVRWWRMGGDWELRVGVRGSPVGIGWVGERRNGWSVGAVNFASTGGLPDRDTACAKVCELLGLPVVLP